MKPARLFITALVACAALAPVARAEDQRHPLNVPPHDAPPRPAAAAPALGLGSGLYAARVAADGTLVSGIGATGAVHIADGTYEVDFDRDVSTCFYTAGSYTDKVASHLQPRSGVPNGVFVIFLTLGSTATDQTPADSQFYLQVICGS